MARGRRGRRGRRGQGKGLSKKAEVDVSEVEVTLGVEKAGIGAAITFTSETLKVSLGIGVAAVELDLGELNNSKVSYAFDLYEIEGARDGCMVTLITTAGGFTVHVESRKIPNCEDEKEPDKEPPDDPLEEPEEGPDKDPTKRPPKLPGNPEDLGYWLVVEDSKRHHKQNDILGIIVWQSRIYRDQSNSFGKIIDDNGKIGYKGTTLKSVNFQLYSRGWVSEDSPLVHRPEKDYSHSPTFDWEGYKVSGIGFSPFGNKQSLVKYGRSPLILAKQWEVAGFIKQEGYYRSDTSDTTKDPTNDDGTPQGYIVYVTINETKLLDHRILEKGLPPRGGMNGSPRNRNKRKPKENQGRRNKMDDICCLILFEIYEALGVEKLNKEGLEMPNKWFAPDGTGYTKAENYLDIQEHQMRMLDHYGIGPIDAKIADTNLLVEGNQEGGAKTINGTQAIQTIIENTMRNDSSNQAVLKTIGAISLSLAQIMRAIDEILKKVKGIKQYLGTPVIMKKFKIPMPFTPGALKAEKVSKKRVSKSGEPLKPEELNLTESLNTILPKFIQNSTQEYSTEVYNEEELTLIERLNPNESIFR